MSSETQQFDSYYIFCFVLETNILLVSWHVLHSRLSPVKDPRNEITCFILSYSYLISLGVLQNLSQEFPIFKFGFMRIKRRQIWQKCSTHKLHNIQTISHLWCGYAFYRPHAQNIFCTISVTCHKCYCSILI